MWVSCKERSLINSLVVFAKLWNTLKCFPKFSFNSELIQTHSLPCCFISIRFVAVLAIRTISELSIKYFRRYIAIQIGHAVNIKGKSSPLSTNFLSWTSIDSSKNELLQESWFSAHEDKFLCNYFYFLSQ